MQSRWLASVVVMVLAATATAQAPQVPAVTVLPPAPIEPRDVGISRNTTEIDIPPGHKLLVLTRVYHNDKLEKSACLAFLPVVNGEWSKHWIWASAYDPSVMLPEPTDKIKLATSNSAFAGAFIVAAKDKSAIVAKAYQTGALQPGQNACIHSLRVGPNLPPNERGEILPAPPEWRVTVLIRLEPMTEKELTRPGADLGRQVSVDPAQFPYKDRDDAEPDVER